MVVPLKHGALLDNSDNSSQKNFQIISEGDIAKCPVCHKAETWDIKQQYCSTCRDVEQSPSVLRLVTESAITQKQNISLVSDDIEVKKLNIKNEMQAMFVKLVSEHKLRNPKDGSRDFSTDDVWGLHQLLMLDLYDNDMNRARLLDSELNKKKLVLMVNSLFLGVAGSLLLDFRIMPVAVSVPLLFSIVIFLTSIISNMGEKFCKNIYQSTYITKYREFEKLHGKNARFF